MKTSTQAVADLVREGAAFVHQPGGFAYTVGVMRQTEPERWFWFEAGRDDEFGMHRFRADRAEVVHEGLGVHFTLKGQFVGYLTTIQEAIDDEEAAKAAQATLGEWRTFYDRSEPLRAAISRAAGA